MGRPCTVCQHHDLAAVDEALVARTSYQPVADRFGLQYGAVRRHAIAHLSPALAAVVAERSVADQRRALDLVDVLYEALSAAMDVLAQARADGHAPAALAAVDAVRKVTMDAARLTGRLDERQAVTVVNLHTDPQFLAARQAILAALAPPQFAAAREAVAASLMRLAVLDAPQAHRMLGPGIAPPDGPAAASVARSLPSGDRAL